MERLLITTKTRAQLEAIRAVTIAMKIDVKNLDNLESQIFGKMIENGDKGDYWTPAEQEELFNSMRK